MSSAAPEQETFPRRKPSALPRPSGWARRLLPRQPQVNSFLHRDLTPQESPFFGRERLGHDIAPHTPGARDLDPLGGDVAAHRAGADDRRRSQAAAVQAAPLAAPP